MDEEVYYMRIHGVVDRIEDDIAIIILDGGEKKINIPIHYLPSNVVEDDVIDISININKNETLKRSGRLRKMMEDTLEDD